MPKKILKKLPTFFLTLTIISTFFFSGAQTNAETLEQLKKKSEDIQKRINDLQNQINKDQANKDSLSAQLGSYDNLIQSTTLQLEEKKVSLDMTQANVDLLNKQREVLEITLQDLKERTDKLKSKADEQTLAIFQLDMQPTVGIIASKSLKDMFVNKAIQSNAKQKTKETYDELKKSKDDYEKKQTALADTIKTTQDLVDKLQKDRQALLDSQNALAQQKNQREAEIDQLEANINQRGNAKNALYQEAINIQGQIAQFQRNILGGGGSGGVAVKKGELIGFEGNTGYICAYSSKVGNSGDICAGFGRGWYKPINEPCAAAHLHFGLSDNGRLVNPAGYMNNGSIGKPLSSYIVTQGFGANPQVYGGGGHDAIDLHQYCGAPIFAVHDGKLSYGCDAYGGKYAMVSGSKYKSVYWHLKKGNGECPASK